MLARVCQVARERGLTPAVMTFEPHPREYFATLNQRPELAPTRISGLRDKLAALARYGVSQVVVERFNARLAEMSANAFICLLYTSPSPRDKRQSRMPSSA